MAIVVRKNPSAARVTDADARALQEKISGMAIEWVPIDSVRSNPRNAKVHPEQQIVLLAENMRGFGVTQPILIDETNTILAGHARFAAERRLGLKEVPVIRRSNLSPQEKRALALADNKLAEFGRWNPEMLRLELKELTVDTGELSFDAAIIGFDTVELDEILGDDAAVARPDPADKVPPLVEPEAVVTEKGDLWVCDDHRVYCGSALEASSYRAVLEGAPADLVFADPLYSVPVAGHAGRPVEGRELPTSAGDPTSEEFIEFLQPIAANIAGNVTPGELSTFAWAGGALGNLEPPRGNTSARRRTW
jgi:hypothetical protein